MMRYIFYHRALTRFFGVELRSGTPKTIHDGGKHRDAWHVPKLSIHED